MPCGRYVQPIAIACCPARIGSSHCAEAGKHTLKYFQHRDLKVELKRDESPVTVADREAELPLRERIAAAFPDDGILGEEFPERAGASGFRWVLDPIDGTKSFIHGVPLYGTLVAVEQGGHGVVGVIEIPALCERSTQPGARGRGMSDAMSRRRARVSDCRRLAEGLVCTTEVRSFKARKSGRARRLARGSKLPHG